jgi:hypothetical protein
MMQFASVGRENFELRQKRKRAVHNQQPIPFDAKAACNDLPDRRVTMSKYSDVSGDRCQLSLESGIQQIRTGLAAIQ